MLGILPAQKSAIAALLFIRTHPSMQQRGSDGGKPLLQPLMPSSEQNSLLRCVFNQRMK